MSLKMQCTDCQKSYKVDDTWAGKRVKCKACGNIMVVPTPVSAIEPPPFDSLAALQTAAPAVAPPPYLAPPPAYQEVTAPDTPYITIPNEDLIDQWVPWAGVGLFAISLLISAGVAVSVINSRASSGKMPSGGAAIATVIATAFILVGGAIAASASGALMLLGVWVGSQIMKFPNHRLLYWRCIAAAAATLGINSLLTKAGLEITAIRWIFAIAGGTGALWLLLRLRGPQFALAGGLAMGLGFLIPALMLVGLQSALKSILPSTKTTSAFAAPPPITRGSRFSSSMPPLNTDPRIGLRETSAAHLKQINQALRMYAQDHQNAGPVSLDNLVSEESLPADQLIAPNGLTYRFVGYAPQAPSNAVVAYEQGDRSLLGGVNILFKDGSIQFFPGNSADPLINAPLINALPGYATNNPPTGPDARTPQMQPSGRQISGSQAPGSQVPQPPHVATPFPNAGPGRQLPPLVRTDVMQVDATALLQQLANGYQSCFSSHNSTYPRSARDLVSAGVMKLEDVQTGRQQILRSTQNLPRRPDLPADLFVAYVLDVNAKTATVLFGDWHVESITLADFPAAQAKSRKVAASMR
jgi:hypothetical protein